MRWFKKRGPQKSSQSHGEHEQVTEPHPQPLPSLPHLPGRKYLRIRQLWARYGSLSFGFFVYLLISLVALYWFTPSWSQANQDALVIGLLINAIFAVTVGVVSALVAVVRPEDQVFDTRLWFLYPGSDQISQSALDSLKESARKLAAPAVRASIHVTVTESETTPTSAFRLTIAVSFTLKNLLRNEPYEDREYEVMIGPDDVTSKDRLGNVAFVQYRCDGSCIEKYREIPIERPEIRFKKPFPITIPKGQEGEVRYEYWAWAAGGTPWQWTMQRLTENLEFTLKNNSGRAVDFDLSVSAGRTASVQIRSMKGQIKPGDPPRDLGNFKLLPAVNTLSLTLHEPQATSASGNPGTKET